MPNAKMKNAPPLYGWSIATVAGIVFAAAAYIAMGIEGNGSVAVGAVVALIVGTIFTIAERPPRTKEFGHVKQVTAPSATAAPTVPASRATPTADDTAPRSGEPIVVEEPRGAKQTTGGLDGSPSLVDSVVAEPSQDVAEGTRPQALAAPQGAPDDLQRLAGIGPVLAGKLNEYGIYHFWQVASWTEGEVAWMDGALNSKGRIARDDWVAQAKLLADNPSTPST